MTIQEEVRKLAAAFEGARPEEILAGVLTLCQDALAGSQRTFVGTSGTDNPNCSLAAPCRTFAAAIAALSPAAVSIGA